MPYSIYWMSKYIKVKHSTYTWTVVCWPLPILHLSFLRGLWCWSYVYLFLNTSRYLGKCWALRNVRSGSRLIWEYKKSYNLVSGYFHRDSVNQSWPMRLEERIWCEPSESASLLWRWTIEIHFSLLTFPMDCVLVTCQ